ncbi:LOW QUALITY PROTEIN: structural maintenance of chromosomes flexible hinge domain-containing protein 1-like [Anableps anableps]
MIQVNDCRFGKKVIKKTLETSGLDFNGFLQVVQKEFAVPSDETFVLTTTDRIEVDIYKFDQLKDNISLYLLQNKDQVLPASVEEEINFVPHYNTLIESGTNEYFTEGQKSLPCSLAELVDNALSATAKNTGVRSIEIRLLFNRTFGKPAIIVLDNGCGMTSKQLNNWAVYRLSKFTRENSTFESEREGYVHPDPVPRSLNSDISYYGVGGKRAVFHMGNSVRMISKPIGSPDVHELVLSKEEFQKKEQNNEDVYRGTILNRMPGDFSHITDDEQFLRSIIDEETGKNSFTVVVITGISQEHIDYLKDDFDEWTRELAHIYHYYIHGVNGNCKTDISRRSDDLPRIDILVTLLASKSPRQMNLREVEDDIQTLFINAAKDTFEFRATTSDNAIVEGVLRYHPFLFDRETYPKDPYIKQVPVEDDDNDEVESGAIVQARGRRDIFECFWNGRLIPYTTISGFDWCQKKRSKLPAECYNRFSGVLFTDGKFLVNANKLKFMKLEKQLNEQNTHFTRVCPTQKTSKRCNIQKEFTQWLQNCHEKLDKQVKFIDYKGTYSGPEVKNKEHPWAMFSSIEVDGKTYKEGQTLKSQKTSQIIYGTVENFFLDGNHKGDVFATGGEVKIKREPAGLYKELTKVIPIGKIDRTATDESIKKHIESEKKKVPEDLKVDWPDGNHLPENAVLLAGTPLGPLKVEILNSNGESILSRIQTGVNVILLSVSLKVVLNGDTEDEEVLCITAPYIAKKGHWFTKIGNLRSLGKYTLTLNAVLNENNASEYGGRELPRYKREFTIKEGNAESFTVGELNSPQRVGVPFNIPLQMKDCYGHPTKPPPDLQPVLQSSGLELSYEGIACSGVLLTIRGVKAKGKLPNHPPVKNYDLKVTLPGLKNDTQNIKLILHPGNPHSLHVKSKTNPMEVENGNPVSFKIEVHDEAGNITPIRKQKVHCQIPGLPLVIKDCSTGKVELVTKPVNQKIVNGEPQMLDAKFEIPSQKQVSPVTIKLMVMPSKRISRMELYLDDEKLVLKNNEKIERQAGGVLKDLFYKLYDEAGRDVPITTEIASTIEVTWGRDVDRRDLVKGRLPELQVPTHVHGEHLYQVSYQDKNVSSCFKVVPCPGEPACLKVTLPQSIVKLGETLSGHIELELVDKYDNVTKTMTATCVKYFSVEAEGLDESSIKFKWNENSSSIVVIGVRFHSGSPGHRVICFRYKDFKENVIFEVTAGVPSQLKLVSGPEQPLQVLNGHDIPTPFLFQLCDEWGNPSPDQNMTVEIRSSPMTLKLTTAVSPPVDVEGKTCIKVNNVEGSKGYYALEFKGSLNGNSIPGPSVNLTLLPDPNKPVELSVNYDINARFSAGGKFPVFSVTVFSEGGSVMTALKPADLSMFLWEGPSSMRPKAVTELICRKPIENERKDCYQFREEEIPTRVGEYTIEFSLQTDKTEVHLKNQINVNVVANEPIKLEPDCQPQTPVVFYCTDIDNRILVENMTLKIMDQFGNSAGQDLNGTVFISIKSTEGERNRSLPLFEGKTNTITISLKEGSAHINSLAIMENSPGENGSQYILLFRPEVTMPPTSLSPFELPFRFYNDAENQQKKIELMKKKDELTYAIKECDKFFDSVRKQKDSLENKVKVTTEKEVSLRNELNKEGIKTEHPLSVGQLALVADNDVARVISWHLQGDMDCVITTTTAAAQKIYEVTKGNQQVMALDSILVQQGDRPLPHIRNCKNLFKPPGNPIFARKELIYSHKEQNCDRDKAIKVFKNLLGDTILMDDLISATNYRKALVEKSIHCPTILTRKGDRVSARGKFGGAQNRVPSTDKLKVFGAPLPEHYYKLKKQIDVLGQYHAAVEEKEKVEKDHNVHSAKWVNEMLHKETKKNEIIKELEEINGQLASVPVRPGKRASGNSESPGIVSKRQRRESMEEPGSFSNMN